MSSLNAKKTKGHPAYFSRNPNFLSESEKIGHRFRQLFLDFTPLNGVVNYFSYIMMN